MIQKLRALACSGQRIRVGVIGCGAMGTGVALQVSRAPGMEVVFVSDIDGPALERGVKATGKKKIEVTNAASPPPPAIR